MKKVMLVCVLILVLGLNVMARENITPEEAQTVDRLMQLGVVEKERTADELNQPLSAIDAMSMEIKGLQVTKEGMIARDKEIIERLGTKIDNLTDEIDQYKKDMKKHNDDVLKNTESLKLLKKSKEDTDKIFAVIGLLLFLFSTR